MTEDSTHARLLRLMHKTAEDEGRIVEDRGKEWYLERPNGGWVALSK